MVWLLGLLALALLGLATPPKGDRLLDVDNVDSSVSDWRASASSQVRGVREGGHRKACVAGILVPVFGLSLVAPTTAGAATRSLPALAQLSPDAGRAEMADPMAISGSRWASAIGDRLRCDWPSTSTAARQFVATESAPEYKKPVEGSGKDESSDAPSWVKNDPAGRPQVGESGKEFAERLLDKKYGEGNYGKGPGSEYSKIKKYGERSFK